jgi:selenocysteine lyase/cysteine desulfurase
MTTLSDPAYTAFLARYPAFAQTRAIDDLRRTEYARLDATGQIYLDYTGGSLYADSQVREHAQLLAGEVFGNPHSANPTSAATTALVERARRAVLEWCGAQADEYTVVFTPNCTGALKLVGESFPFSERSALVLSTDNHNSVNGIREFATAAGGRVDYVPLTAPDLRLDPEALRATLARPGQGPSLFVYPAQSNFTGVRHPLSVVREARAAGWTVMLDAAAFVPTSRLVVGDVDPDFVTLSFYKIFGYPTGVGALIARKTALAKLRRPWFAGGTVNFATVSGRRHLLSSGEAAFEDGTLNYLSIPAVEIGLRLLARVGIDAIHTRVECLTGWLLDALLAMRHGNGRPMVRIYGPTTVVDRGGTVTLNFYDPEGHLLDYRRVEELAGAEGISLRTGCFCNPGAGETAEGLTAADVEAALSADADMSLPRFLQFVTHRSGKSAGAIRVSLGIASTFGDVSRFLAFAEGFRDQSRLAIGDASFDIESCRIIRDGS